MTSGGPLRVEPVAGKAQLRRFIEMPAALYAGDPLWVQPLTMERLEHLDPKKNPSLQHMELQLWTAFRGDRPVGRISAQVNRAHIARYADATGHFGFLEAEDDPETFAALLGVAGDWLKQRGMRRVTGPFTLSINDESGLLVDGFDTPPSMMMGHHHRYYAPRLEALGFAKIKDLIAYDFDVVGEWPRAAQAIVDRLDRMPGVRIRPVDMKRLDDELQVMGEVFNDAWADNWGFLPWTRDEIRALGRNIRPLVTVDNFGIGEVDGEPAAMVVTLPNINEAIRDLGGRLLPFGIVKLLWRLKVQGVKTGRMPLMGVRRRYHGTRKGAALALGVIRHAREGARRMGVRRGELSWILEDNRGVRDLIELVGATPYKTYRVYEKTLA